MMKDDALGFDRCGHNATSAAFSPRLRNVGMSPAALAE